jgi:hypothetical protein
MKRSKLHKTIIFSLFCINTKFGLSLSGSSQFEGVWKYCGVENGTGRNKGVGGWRKLYNEDLHNLYSLHNSPERVMKWAGYVAHMGHMRNSYISVENPTGNRPVAGWG